MNLMQTFLSQLDHEETCVNFTIERWYPVANMSRFLPLRVYDYYAPGKHLILFLPKVNWLINDFVSFFQSVSTKRYTIIPHHIC